LRLHRSSADATEGAARDEDAFGAASVVIIPDWNRERGNTRQTTKSEEQIPIDHSRDAGAKSCQSSARSKAVAKSSF